MTRLALCCGTRVHAVRTDPCCARDVPNGGSARCYQAIFVPSTALASPGYDGQPAVHLHIAALEVNVLKCRGQGQTSRAWRETWPCPGSRLASETPDRCLMVLARCQASGVAAFRAEQFSVSVSDEVLADFQNSRRRLNHTSPDARSR